MRGQIWGQGSCPVRVGNKNNTDKKDSGSGQKNTNHKKDSGSGQKKKHQQQNYHMDSVRLRCAYTIDRGRPQPANGKKRQRMFNGSCDTNGAKFTNTRGMGQGGKARRQDKTRQRRDETRRDKTRRDETRRGRDEDETRRDKTRQDEARRDKTTQDETRRDKT